LSGAARSLPPPLPPAAPCCSCPDDFGGGASLLSDEAEYCYHQLLGGERESEAKHKTGVGVEEKFWFLRGGRRILLRRDDGEIKVVFWAPASPCDTTHLGKPFLPCSPADREKGAGVGAPLYVLGKRPA
ncbi:hypothetical protein Taro_014408, partial [Colocasia esculenta]|nr:hypothetical protein [Colocasia esculenta]